MGLFSILTMQSGGGSSIPYSNENCVDSDDFGGI
jgi:hypothetical protein